MNKYNDEPVELLVYIKHETFDAILCAVKDNDDEEDNVWLPKSQVTLTKRPKTDAATISIPLWLAEKKELL